MYGSDTASTNSCANVSTIPSIKGSIFGYLLPSLAEQSLQGAMYP